MLVYITGVPGSGKTYKAVDHIYRHFGQNSNDDKYLWCYTNIDGFDFSKVDDRVRKLDFDSLKSKLHILHDMYKHKATDAELIEKAQELEIYKALFVIDEAHNFFQNRDQVLVWWLTYHRHLYQDIFLITQNLALIESKYKPLAEYFYKAVPSSLRFSKKVFRYNVYVDQRMYKDSRAKVEKLKLNPEVFALYHAGDDTNAPNFLKRFFLLGSAFLFLAGFALYFFINLFFSSGDDSPAPPPQKKVVQVDRSDRSDDLSFSDGYTLVNLDCFDADCEYLGKKFDFSVLNFLVEKSDSYYLHAKKLDGSNRVTITLLASPAFIKFFRSSKNEKSSPSVFNPFAGR